MFLVALRGRSWENQNHQKCLAFLKTWSRRSLVRYTHVRTYNTRQQTDRRFVVDYLENWELFCEGARRRQRRRSGAARSPAAAMLCSGLARLNAAATAAATLATRNARGTKWGAKLRCAASTITLRSPFYPTLPTCFVYVCRWFFMCTNNFFWHQFFKCKRTSFYRT